MQTQINRQYQLAQRPSGLPGRDTFSFVEAPLGEPGDGQI
ncbi:NADP-dependent oxidoreductase, partial [Pseudomonas aeruginosa]|nr:NADP-dependent oxidoreductase [Pseudomonas aeruginosa]